MASVSIPKDSNNPSFHNDYCGFISNGTRTKPGSVDRLSIDSLTPKSFWDRFVHTRRPVVISGLPSKFSGMEKWTNEYLADISGNEDVEIEHRENVEDFFGQGQKSVTKMKFSKFMKLLRTGNGLHYMTSQTLDVDEDNWPPLMTAPALQLYQKGHFPLRLPLLGNLIPSAINIWMGQSKNGSSSGLHHDYHDNLYLLVRGKKRFRLYSPSDAQYMYTNGALSCVHSNGLINYEGFPTDSCGLDDCTKNLIDVECAKAAAEKELHEAEQAFAKDEPGARERKERAEEMMDNALDRILALQNFDDYDSEDEVESEEEVTIGLPNKRRRKNTSQSKTDASSITPIDKTKQDPSIPVNFSRIKDSSDPNLERFPLFHNAKPLVCEIHDGDMLYLPAGWFHEVISFGSQNETKESNQPYHNEEISKEKLSKIGKKKDGHLALNYWMHPPNGDFKTPYPHKLWNELWNVRNLELNLNDHCIFDKDNNSTCW